MQASFSFLAPRRLVAIDAHNSGAAPATVTITCAGNPDKTAVVPAAATVTITTGWVSGCTTATLAASNGWDTNFDNVLYDDAGIPPDETAPTISNVQAVPSGTTATISWTTDENADSQVESAQRTRDETAGQTGPDHEHIVLAFPVCVSHIFFENPVRIVILAPLGVDKISIATNRINVIIPLISRR